MKNIKDYTMTIDYNEVVRIANLFEDSTNKLIKKDLRWESFTPVIIKELRKANLFIDIGAEYGYYINLFLKYSKKESRMIAIEPEPDRVDALKKYFSQKRITILPYAISQENSTLKLYKYEGKSASADKNLSQWDEDNKEKIFFEVESKKLDKLLEEEIPDLIKIDIEGAEIFAFQGMEEILKKHSPTIFLEYHEKFVKSLDINGKKIIENILEKNNYEIYDYRGVKTSLDKGRVILATPEKAKSIDFIKTNYERNMEFSKNFNIFYNTVMDYQKNYSKIIIYGAGTIGQTMYKIINKNNIKAIVDKNKFNYSDFKVNNLDYLNTITSEEYDKIIITVLGREEEIIENLLINYNIDSSKILTFTI